MNIHINLIIAVLPNSVNPIPKVQFDMEFIQEAHRGQDRILSFPIQWSIFIVLGLQGGGS